MNDEFVKYWVAGCTDFTDFHEIFTDFESNRRKNLVKIREIRTSINPFSLFVLYGEKIRSNLPNPPYPYPFGNTKKSVDLHN